ncbi:Primosomal protein N' [bioreactor metagenome]|uniref:DNA 3'-5' helicase n=1 Tax=bioreactor metagenome TaxID=1076179 RepID=A0A645ASR0_9ZZZZ
MAQATISPRIACYQAMLPNKLSPKSNNQRIKMLEYVRFQNTLLKLTGKQQAALKALENDKELLCADWRKLFGPSVTKTLIDKGCVLLYQREARYQAETVKPLQTPLKLTVYQQAAFDEIVTTDDPVYLLHGATGSGKTEIYLQLAQQKVAAGEQVLIMVPEISLTPQMVERVKQRFGDRVAIYHSALNDQQKYEQFMRVYDQEVAVVVGTRSAAFMPFKKLGLIVLDEEHDHSYKQESTPCYHCRDIVLRRGAYHHCKVILGSATPALESYARAQKKVYHLISLPQRINDQPLPVCRVVDVRSMLRKGLSGIITLPLEEAIKARLLKKEQIIILLNRRGYTPLQQCVECSSVIMCPDCDIAMNYHKDKNLLVCHTCGRMMALPKTCPVCHGQHWTHSGFGTQKLEEEMVRLFPQAKILRMDADTVRRKNGHQRILERFGSHEADILVGTQMIAKGLDYPSVTLVGVINADAALAHSDFRSVETTFDLIVQASGRSGRGLAAGEVIIQAYDVQHYVIQTASRHDYQKFYAYEMQYRHAGNYPPYTYLISIVFTHTRLETMQSSVQQLAEDLRLQPEYKVLGPSELYRTFNKCRLRIILKGKNLEAMIAAVTNQLHDFQKANGAVSILVDVNPLRVE